MPNSLTQSSQTKSTCAPQYYNDYLQGIVQKGQQAECKAQYVGATPLQQKAFTDICKTAGAQAPNYATAQGYVGCAAGKNISGAATPFLTAATSASPLCAAKPLICQSSNLNLGEVAGQYMNPYIRSAVQQMSDIGQRNIMQNIDPAAMAGLVGSGQFGSQRGAQVMGQVNANAEQDLNSQIANMLSSGYGQALQAAGTKQGALTNLANTTATAQQAQNAAENTAATTAANAAAACATAKERAGLAAGTLAGQAAATNLNCINALATLGAQCQTIKQNALCYDFNKLSKEAALMQGISVPTSTKTTMCMSPLSTAASLASIAKGVACSKGLSCALCKAWCKVSSIFGCHARGGLITAGGAVGCRSTRNLGGLPRGGR